MDKFSMPAAVAFFPWFSMQDLIEAGPIRLIPYEVGGEFERLQKANQKDIDKIVSTYSPRKGSSVKQCSLLEFADWQTGQDVDSHVLQALFEAKELVAFCALSQRRLFSGVSSYCNTHNFSMVIQKYEPGRSGGLVYQTRRRDGGTSNYWSSNEFSFFQPIHVQPERDIDIDLKLLKAIVELKGERYEQVLLAIEEYNQANTDSPDIPEHVEIVMTKSAIDRLLELGDDRNRFVYGIERALKGIYRVEDGFITDASWGGRFQADKSNFKAWAKEFCDIRGASAHAGQRGAGRFVWKAKSHLAFSSMLFPLLLKIKLCEWGGYRISEIDIVKLKSVDHYLSHDPFSFDWDGDKRLHPWQEIESEVLLRRLIERNYDDFS